MPEDTSFSDAKVVLNEPGSRIEVKYVGNNVNFFSDQNATLYKEEKIIGKGTYAQVILAKTEDNQLWAVKKFDLTSFSEEDRLQYKKIIDVETQINQDLGIGRAGVVIDGIYYQIQRYLGSDLNHVNIEVKEKLKIASLVANKLNQLHLGLLSKDKKPYIHLDIKKENILYDAQGDIHLIDFGLAYQASFFAFGKVETQGGELIGEGYKYIAPEVKDEEKILSFFADIYSFGVFLKDFLDYENNGLLPLLDQMTVDNYFERPSLELVKIALLVETNNYQRYLFAEDDLSEDLLNKSLKELLKENSSFITEPEIAEKLYNLLTGENKVCFIKVCNQLEQYLHPLFNIYYDLDKLVDHWGKLEEILNKGKGKEEKHDIDYALIKELRSLGFQLKSKDPAIRRLKNINDALYVGQTGTIKQKSKTFEDVHQTIDLSKNSKENSRSIQTLELFMKYQCGDKATIRYAGELGLEIYGIAYGKSGVFKRSNMRIDHNLENAGDLFLNYAQAHPNTRAGAIVRELGK
ncbi:protein kinase [Thiotrichales bacterium 19S11-10]|nr:protein kinase [Thiotrichales bacterium 19S11-10]